MNRVRLGLLSIRSLAIVAVLFGGMRLALAEGRAGCKPRIIYDVHTRKHVLLSGCPESCFPDSGVCHDIGGLVGTACRCMIGAGMAPEIYYSPAYNDACILGFIPDLGSTDEGVAVCGKMSCTGNCYRVYAPFEPLEPGQVWTPPEPPDGIPPLPMPNGPEVFEVTGCDCH